jgi:hypothetical protein
MKQLTREHLSNRVDLLKQKGVHFPADYVPSSLPEDSVHFRARSSEILAVDLLAGVFPPHLIEVDLPDLNGDTDILISIRPPHRFQVKSPVVNEIGGEQTLDEIVRSARATAWDVFTGHRRDRPAFSLLKVKLNNAREPVLNGNTWSVSHPVPVHAVVVEVDRKLLEPMLKRNIGRWLNKAMDQLAKYEDSILVPTIDLSWYPADQRLVYTYTRELFKNNPSWTKASGVLYIMRGYSNVEVDDGFAESHPRLIGVENPNAPSSRRLDASRLNPNLLDEDVFAETMVIISVEPFLESAEIRNRILYVGTTPFGAIPKGLAGPFIMNLR